MKIVISGLGLMGASLALALKRADRNSIICGYDFPDVLKYAVEHEIIDQAIENWPDDCADAEIIFLATPLQVIEKHLADLNGKIAADTIVTDLGSTKQHIENFVRRIQFQSIYVGGHPLAGAEKTGIRAANPLLYENAIYVLTGSNVEQEAVSRKLIPLLNRIKARIIHLSAAEHDQVVAYTSHLPQLLAIAMVNIVANKNKENDSFQQLAAGGFRDLTRIADSGFQIWHDIFYTNLENVKQAIDQLMSQLQQMKHQLPDVEAAFLQANEFRRQIPKSYKGFLSPLVDVLVYVDDQMGTVSRLSTALYKKRIDIRDIELLKIREGEGGVFRLSFSSLKDAQDAIETLNKIGFKAYLRD